MFRLLWTIISLNLVIDWPSVSLLTTHQCAIKLTILPDFLLKHGSNHVTSNAAAVLRFLPTLPIKVQHNTVALLVFVACLPACLPACDQYHVIIHNLVSPLPGVLKQISQMHDSNSNVLPRSWTQKCFSFSNIKLQFYLLLCVDAKLWPLWLHVTNCEQVVSIKLSARELLKRTTGLLDCA